MKQSEITSIIETLSIKNPLRENIDKDYTQRFINKIVKLSIVDKHLDSKIKLLISEGKEYNKFKYNQSISELLLWFLCESKNLKYNIEAKVNSTKKNVDLQATFMDKTFNFEVKSPEYPFKVEGQMTGRIANRSMLEDLRKIAIDFEEKLMPYISQGNFTSIKTYAPTDNKLKDCLLSAHKKFDFNNANTTNILFVCTNTEELVYYLHIL